MRTLLVEDDFAHAKIIKRALGDVVNAEEIFHVSDGGLALDYIYSRGPFGDRDAYPLPELILLDLRLPGIDGYEVLETLKEDATTRSIPVVVLSTSDRPHDINRCYAAGANAFVTKPLDYAEFSRRVLDICHFWNFTAELPFP